ncbi:hypothetical protein K456DRAFT_446012 [Colletotrichum gloeosporioides 23]|nr:hypothetical protein K456DRAFT_446012 [Colletotrichum gloeosporioides 23]
MEDDDDEQLTLEIGRFLTTRKTAMQQDATSKLGPAASAEMQATPRGTDGGDRGERPGLGDRASAEIPAKEHVTRSPATRSSQSQNTKSLLRRAVNNRHSIHDMRSHTPSGDPPGRRGSVTNRFRNSTGGSALPRPHTSLRESRFRATQPTYNLFTGGDANSRPGSRQSSVRAASRESSKENMAPPDAAEYESQRQVIEELKAELGTLRYTISTFEQEKEMAEARHKVELEEERRRAQLDFTAKQTAESEKSQAQRQFENVQKELSDLREGASEEKSSLEKRARSAEDEAGLLQEQLEDLSSAKDEAARINEKTELSEARMQRQRLEDERMAWTAYLASTGTEAEFESPEDRIGALQAELAAQESALSSLKQEHATLKSQLAEAKTAATTQNVDKARLRTERQRVLAVKEVEYLRAQLKTFDAEDEAFQPESVDETKSRRIQELEDLVDKYRSEVQALHTEMSSIESGKPAPTVAGTKRPRDENDEAAHEQVGLLTRKNRKLQDQLSSVQTQHSVTQKELSVVQEQLKTLKARSKTRILSLRSNPTSDFEAIKMSTLTALKQENADLLAQLRSDPSVRLIPITQLDAANRLVKEARAETASAQKSAKRLKEVWSKKSLEFKEAIFSTLGWTVMFMPNGKMRVESTFYPSQTDEYENSIVFDGEKGTMKVGGGPKSAFARRIGDQIGFWVREKGCIPGFLAALTLEFYEEHSRNQNSGE